MSNMSLTRPMVAAAVLLVCIARLNAAPLLPGGSVSPVPGEARPSGAATLLASTGPVAFSVAGVFSGTLASQVYSDPNSTLGGLTFTYLLANTGTSGQNVIGALSLFSFNGFQLDVSYDTGSSGVAPAFVDRFGGSTVVWNFSGVGDGPIAPGEVSRTLVIETNATLYGLISASVIDGQQVSGLGVLGPVVPLPMAAWMGISLLGTLGGARLIRRRRDGVN